MQSKLRMLMGLVLAGMIGSAEVQAADVEKARILSEGIKRAKTIVDRAIFAAHGTESLDDSESVLENDAVALPIYMQASSSLGNAAVHADQSVASFLTGNIAFGNYSFSVACAKMGIGRSQVSRANFAALLPPAGFLTAFGPDLTELVTELGLLKLTVGCP